MAGDLFAALEATALARTLRDSVWAYPLVNAGHILGVALLVGAIVPLDLRLLGFFRSLPLEPLQLLLTRAAAVGLCLAAAFGVLLFITRASEYAQSSLFLLKMLVVLAAVVNVIVSRRLAIVDRATGPDAMRNPRLTRASAALSLMAWITALVLGRLVGYF